MARQHAHTGVLIKHTIKHKGWAIADAARYLGVSRQRLYQVFSQREPTNLWLCAARGLPKATRSITAPYRAERARVRALNAEKRTAKQPAARHDAAGALLQYEHYDVGDELSAKGYVGAMAESEGDLCVLIGMRLNADQPQFHVRGQNGEQDWFDRKDFEALFAQTGRMLDL